MLSANFYNKKRSQLLELLPRGSVAVLAGHRALQRSADITYPFRQDSNVLYLSGICEPDMVLVLSENESFAIVPKRSEFTALWDSQNSLDQLMKQSGLDMVVEERAGWKRLEALLKRVQNVHILEPVGSLPWGGQANPGRARLKRRLKSRLSSQHSLSDLRPLLSSMRMTKEQEEIAAIKTASDITARGYKNVFDAIATSAYEYELQALFTQTFESQNTSHAYEPIVASGHRSCVLHYNQNNQPLEDNIVLFDVAAQWKGYSCDVSRTVPLKGAFSKRQQDVYDAVLDVQQRVISQLNVGMTFVDVDKVMRELVTEKLVALGLLKTPDVAESRAYYPHTSHFVGLDVHDAGDYRKPLKENTVLTIEPGIYIPEEKIGVRIEDIIHLTVSGPNILTKSIPK